jgi:hypothetical protein
MKRATVFLMAVMLLLGFAACGETELEQQPTGDNSSGILSGVGDIIQFGDFDWRVLDVRDGKALVISDKILEINWYSTEFGDMTWESCSLREGLNTGFYDMFSAADKARIIETRVENEGGSGTDDRIFLLSIAEAEQYFASDDDRIALSANSNPLYDEGEAGAWWLRSPGADAHLAAVVRADGSINTDGDYIYHADMHSAEEIMMDGSGVRPAMWISLDEQGDPVAETPTDRIPSDENPVVVLDGTDITAQLALETIDGVVYAEGKDFVESLRSEYDDRQEYYLDFDAGENTIYIISYATDVPIYKLYPGSTTAQRIEDVVMYTYGDKQMSAPPLIENGEVFLPVEAFAELTGHVASFG